MTDKPKLYIVRVKLRYDEGTSVYRWLDRTGLATRDRTRAARLTQDAIRYLIADFAQTRVGLIELVVEEIAE